MNHTAIKTFVARLSAQSIHEFDVDCELFEDPLLEAATRAVEKERTNKEIVIRPVIQCWAKKTPNKTYVYNSYWILVNAGRYDRAERLREKFRMQTDFDLATQPYHGSKPCKLS